VSRLWHGTQARIATGFPSYAPADGSGATGPHAVSLHGRGGAYVTIGLGGEGDPLAFRAVMGDGFGRTARMHPNGKWQFEDDLAQYEVDNNPDESPVPDSQPYGILSQPGGRVVIDSGGNDLLRVKSNGRISTLGVFESRPQGRATDSVPTSVKVGPDGAYYVGELTGVPFPANEARIYRVDPPNAPTVFLTGFTAVIDLAWGPDGRLYVLQFASGPGLTGPGVLIRVNADGSRTPVVTDLIAPGGVAFGPDGAAYITNKSVLAGAGEVLRVAL
jgi:sugar lactone lactonase YvrE